MRICFKSAKIYGSANRKSANRKIDGKQIANPQIATFADLRFPELNCGPPTFATIHTSRGPLAPVTEKLSTLYVYFFFNDAEFGFSRADHF